MAHHVRDPIKLEQGLVRDNFFQDIVTEQASIPPCQALKPDTNQLALSFRMRTGPNYFSCSPEGGESLWNEEFYDHLFIEAHGASSLDANTCDA